MTGWQAGTQSFVPKSCDFVVVAKNPLTLPFRSFDDWHESHDCQGTRWKQAATNQGPWPKNEYKCQVSTFVFLLKHECTEWRAERCVLVFQNQGPCAPGTKPFAIRNKNATFRFPKFVSCVGCSDSVFPNSCHVWAVQICVFRNFLNARRKRNVAYLGRWWLNKLLHSSN